MESFDHDVPEEATNPPNPGPYDPESVDELAITNLEGGSSEEYRGDAPYENDEDAAITDPNEYHPDEPEEETQHVKDITASDAQPGFLLPPSEAMTPPEKPSPPSRDVDDASRIIVEYNVGYFADMPSAPNPLEIRQQHLASVESILARHKPFVEEIFLGDGRTISEVRLECTMPGGVAFTHVTSEGTVTIYNRDLQGKETIHRYKPGATGIIRSDPSAEAERAMSSRAGDLPIDLSWALEFDRHTQSDMNQELARSMGIGDNAISAEEEQYLIGLLEQSDLRRVTFSELDAIFQRRRASETPTTVVESARGAVEFSQYVAELFERDGRGRKYTAESPLVKDVIGDDGSYVVLKAGTKRQDGVDAPFIEVHADWSTPPEQLAAMTLRQPERFQGVYSAKTSIDLRYAVLRGRLYVTKRAVITDELTKRPLAKNPPLSVLGDRLEARRIRIMALNPTFSRRPTSPRNNAK